MQCTTLHCIALNYTALNCSTLHFSNLNHTKLNFTSLQNPPIFHNFLVYLQDHCSTGGEVQEDTSDVSYYYKAEKGLGAESGVGIPILQESRLTGGGSPNLVDLV